MRYHRVIGIDLGRTNSVVSVWDYEEQQVISLPNPVNRVTAVPSVVSQSEGAVIVGTNARENLFRDPENTIIEIKEILGAYEDNVNYTPKKVHFRDRDWLPQEILAFILEYLKAISETYIGEPVYDAVIAIPAYFVERQRTAVVEAAEIAHLNVKQLVREPVAAALGFGIDTNLDEAVDYYLIYDLGKRTLDVSIISCSKDAVEIIATSGDSNLGGKDFDDCLTDYVISEIQKRYHIDLSQDSKVREYIRQDAELRKCELSQTDSTIISLPYLTPQLVDIHIDLQRPTFETLITPKVKQMLTYLYQALENFADRTGLYRDDIKKVLLVGGSTRIPLVRSMIADYLSKDISDVRVDVDPTEVISHGAAILAARFQPSNGYEGKDFRNPAA